MKTTIQQDQIRETSEERNYSGFLLFADAALPAFLGAVLAILTILACMARIGTCASRCGSAQRNLAEEKNPQHDMSQNK
jgi:hypothetical protein